MSRVVTTSSEPDPRGYRSARTTSLRLGKNVEAFFSMVSAASWSHSTAESVENPAASMPRSRPPAPENSETAEPTITAPACTVRRFGARTLAGVRRLSWTPFDRRSRVGEDMGPVDTGPVTANESRGGAGNDPAQYRRARTVNLGGGQVVPYPEPTDAAATKIGQANRRSGTKPEIRLRCGLHRRGLRFRKDLLLRAGDVRTHPDIVFTRWKVAVFVDGCFWHGCPDHQHVPKSNRDYWVPKLAANVARDRRVDDALSAAGWSVVHIWEHVAVDVAIDRVASTLTARRDRLGTRARGAT